MFLPKIIAKAKEVKYPARQQGKVIKFRSENTNKIAKDQIVVNRGDLIHMDQAESLTPGRPLTYRRKVIKRKYLSYPCL